jgi:hypothetical protein
VERRDYEVLAKPPSSAASMKVQAAAGGLAVDVTLAFGHHEDRTPTHGYELTREAPMAAFAKSG